MILVGMFDGWRGWIKEGRGGVGRDVEAMGVTNRNRIMVVNEFVCNANDIRWTMCELRCTRRQVKDDPMLLLSQPRVCTVYSQFGIFINLSIGKKTCLSRYSFK